MTTVYDVPGTDLIMKLKEELKEVEAIKPPEWASYVKTGVSRERQPQEEDWWYTRAASILRRIYTDGPVGVERLRVYYGGKKNRGHKPEKFRKASGAVIRNILKQLEGAGFVEGDNGRRISPKGRALLDKLSHEIKLELQKKYPELERY